MTTTIPQALASAVRRHPATPLLTWYDDASGDRTELSGATLDNWVSKTANMFIDGLGLGGGDTVAVLLPPHWQTAAIVLGAAGGGRSRALRGEAPPIVAGAAAAGLSVRLGDEPRPVEALFTSPEGVARAEAWST